MFKKASSLALLSLLRIFKWIYLKSVFYFIGLNQLFSAMLDHFSDFITFINVLSKTYLNLASFLLVSPRKISLLSSH